MSCPSPSCPTKAVPSILSPPKTKRPPRASGRRPRWILTSQPNPAGSSSTKTTVVVRLRSRDDTVHRHCALPRAGEGTRICAMNPPAKDSSSLDRVHHPRSSMIRGFASTGGQAGTGARSCSSTPPWMVHGAAAPVGQVPRDCSGGGTSGLPPLSPAASSCHSTFAHEVLMTS